MHKISTHTSVYSIDALGNKFHTSIYNLPCAFLCRFPFHLLSLTHTHTHKTIPAAHIAGKGLEWPTTEAPTAFNPHNDGM